MWTRDETIISNAFTISSILTMYFFDEHAFFNSQSPASYDFWQLLYIDGGNYACTVNDSPIEMSHGQVLLCCPGTRRKSHVLTGNIGIISFRCQSSQIDTISNQVLNLSLEHRQVLSQIFQEGLDIFELNLEVGKVGQRIKSGTPDIKLQKLKNRLELFLIDLCETHTLHQSPLNPLADNQINYFQKQYEDIENYLKANVRNNITIEDVVTHSNLSMSTLIRLYKKFHTGGVMHHFMQLKIEEAKRLIRLTDMNMTQIAEYLGFSSLHYFSRTFKKFTDISPSEYAHKFVKR